LKSSSDRGQHAAQHVGLLEDHSELFGSSHKLGDGGSGALLGTSFLFDVLGAIGDFVVEGLISRAREMFCGSLV